MKCPKCSYLGFETGDRCKNCGYDFSLLAASAEPPDPDLNLHVPEEIRRETDRLWIDRLHSGVEEVAEAHEMAEPALAAPSSSVFEIAPPAATADSAFPLFDPRTEDDEPLIKLPATPRPPLSVRRTTEPPRFKTLNRSDDPALTLEFSEDTLVAPAVRSPVALIAPIAPVAVSRVESPAHTADDTIVSSLPRRAAAGLTDHVILFAIDLIVLYSTLRMAGLTMSDWSLLPPLPMIAFLALLKVSYFGAFTAACGQTIGKMAARIRVVSDDAPLDPGRAIRRTLVSAVSLAALGAGFIPALLDPDHRALHDRVARTRVVELPSI